MQKKYTVTKLHTSHKERTSSSQASFRNRINYGNVGKDLSSPPTQYYNV